MILSLYIEVLYHVVVFILTESSSVGPTSGIRVEFRIL